MTTLAWLIYLANVSGALKALATIVSFLGSIGTLIGWVFVKVIEMCEGADAEEVKIVTPMVKLGCAVSVVALTLLVFVPSKNTIMMMAAASYGEDLYKSELKDIVDPAKKLLRQWIEDQLKEAK